MHVIAKDVLSWKWCTWIENETCIGKLEHGLKNKFKNTRKGLIASQVKGKETRKRGDTVETELCGAPKGPKIPKGSLCGSSDANLSKSGVVPIAALETPATLPTPPPLEVLPPSKGIDEDTSDTKIAEGVSCQQASLFIICFCIIVKHEYWPRENTND